MLARPLLRPPHVPFVGREQLFARAKTTFEGGARLVTFTGPGGIGKTRLAAELAAKLTFDGGTIWVDLTEARSLEDFTATLGAALDVRAGGSTATRLARIGEALAARGRALVVLDDFEELVDAASTALADLGLAAPEVAFLVTSRERTRLRAETCLPLEPLALAREDAPAHVVREAEAVRFFVACARATNTTFELRAEDVLHASAIVRALEGVPLAIELAAAQEATLGLAALSARLEAQRTESVRAREGDAALVRTLEWSWSALEPLEQEALARCSIFRGGFTFEAAVAVIGGPNGTALELLQALHDRSLLRSVPVEELPGERRLHLFESIRAFAADKRRAAGLEEAVVRAHERHYLEVAGAWARDIDGPNGVVQRRRLALEIDNLLAIAERPIAAGEGTAEIAPRLEAALFLDAILAHPRTPLPRLKEALERLADALGQGPLVARARLGLGRIALLEGRFTDTAHAFAEARAAARRANAAEVEALALVYEGGALVMRDEHEAGEARLREAEALAPPDLTRALLAGWRAEAHTRREEPRAAAEHYQTALTLFRRRGDRLHEGMAEGSLALAWLDLGLLERAEQACTACIAIAVEASSRRDEGYGLATLGRVLLARGDVAEARAALVRALERQRGDLWGSGQHELRLGELELEAERPGAAVLHLRRAERLLGHAGDKRYAALAAAVLSAALASEDALAEAEAAAERASSGAGGDGATSLGVRIHLGHLDLARARSARAEGDEAAAAQHAKSAAARAETPPGDSEQARLAGRVLRRALAADHAPNPPSSRGEGAPSTRVARDGSWLETEDGARHDLTRRKAFQAILAELVRARAERPGDATSAKRLLAVGWPEESEGAKESRVYVAITRLRKLGLGSLLVSRDDGFLLDAKVRAVDP